MPSHPRRCRPEEYAAVIAAFAGCGFRAHTMDALARNDLGTPAKLLALPARELRYLNGIGKKGRAEIEAWLARMTATESIMAARSGGAMARQFVLHERDA